MTERATPLDLSVVTDNSGAFSSVPVSNDDRIPSGRLEFDYVPATKRWDPYYEVRASGPIFGPGPVRKGVLKRAAFDVIGAINDCRDTWLLEVVQKRIPRPGNSGSLPYKHKNEILPYSRDWNLSGSQYAGLLDDVAPELARAGQTLFENIFGQGDEGLTEIANLLKAALRGGPAILAIQSASLFAPWWMLYTPPDRSVDLYATDFRWDLRYGGDSGGTST